MLWATLPKDSELCCPASRFIFIFAKLTISCLPVSSVCLLKQFEQNIGRKDQLRMGMPAGDYVTPRDIGLWENEFLEQHSQSSNLLDSPAEASVNSSAFGNGDIYETGIKLRIRQTYHHPPAELGQSQGTAPRRIRLQKKLQVGPFYCSNLRDVSHIEQSLKPKLEPAEVRESVRERVWHGDKCLCLDYEPCLPGIFAG